MKINYMFSRIDRDKGFNDNQKKYIKEDIKNDMSITFIASLFDEYERNDTQVKEIVNVFKNIDINFKEVHLIDNRVSKEDAYKYIEKTDIVYLMGGSPELEMKSIKDDTVDIKTLDGKFSDLKDTVCKMANKLDIKGYAKLDFRLHDDKCYLIEINSQVSFHPEGEFITCAKKDGYEFNDIVCYIVSRALTTSKKINSIGIRGDINE